MAGFKCCRMHPAGRPGTQPLTMPTSALQPAPSPSRSSDPGVPDPNRPRVERAPAGVVAAHGCWTALAFSDARDWKALAAALAQLPAAEGAGWDLRPIGQLDHVGAQLHGERAIAAERHGR